MPATSKAQRRLFALALAVKRGEVPASDVDDKIKDLAKRSEQDLKDFAETPEETLPNKVEDKVEENNAMATPGSVNGMGAVALPGNPGTNETGSGDLAATSALTSGNPDKDGKKAKKIYKFLKYNAFVGESVNEGKMPNKYIGNDEIVYLKTKEDSKGANYNLYYKGHDIEAGGIRVGSEKELKNFAKDYILSNQMYNKLKYEKPKALPESVDEAKGFSFPNSFEMKKTINYTSWGVDSDKLFKGTYVKDKILTDEAKGEGVYVNHKAKAEVTLDKNDFTNFERLGNIVQVNESVNEARNTLTGSPYFFYPWKTKVDGGSHEFYHLEPFRYNGNMEDGEYKDSTNNTMGRGVGKKYPEDILKYVEKYGSPTPKELKADDFINKAMWKLSKQVPREAYRNFDFRKFGQGANSNMQYAYVGNNTYELHLNLPRSIRHPEESSWVTDADIEMFDKIESGLHDIADKLKRMGFKVTISSQPSGYIK